MEISPSQTQQSLIDDLFLTSEDCPTPFTPFGSPVAQWPMWGVPQPYDWQLAILDACWRPGANVCARTCNESGKTSLVVPLLALSWAAAFPGSQVVITSASEDQIKLQLWPALSAMASRNGWAVTGTQIKATVVDRDVPASTINIRVTKQGERFEGFHNRTYISSTGDTVFAPLLIIADEAKSIKGEIFTAIERCNPVCRLYISTCGEDTGDFYEACMNRNGLWTTEWEWQGETIPFKIPWTMCPHLNRGNTKKVKQAMLDAKGPNDPDVCSILMAEFFRGGTFMVFDESDMAAARDAMSGHTPHVPGQRVAFCDFSGGGDELTFGIRDGNLIHPVEAWNQDSTVPPSAVADRYIGLFRRWGLKAEQVWGDNGGLGALIINELQNKGWPINRVNANHKARYEGGFADRYAEMHWSLKQHLHNRGLILPRDDVLLDQMRLRRYIKRNGDENRIRMEPKQEARKQRQENSPDRLDTVVHLVADMENVRIDAVSAKATVCGSPKEYWDAVAREKEQAGLQGADGFMGDW